MQTHAGPVQAAVNYPALSTGSPTGTMGMILMHVLSLPELGELTIIILTTTTTMSLMKNERAIIMSMWEKMAAQAEPIGTETLER